MKLCDAVHCPGLELETVLFKVWLPFIQTYIGSIISFNHYITKTIEKAIFSVHM